MAKKLDAAQIERERHQGEKSSHREEEKQRIRETIAKNRTGERKVTVIMPAPKEGENAEDKKIRVAAYCRVSTDDDDQVGSFDMQVHHFTSIIENNPQYEMVRIYKDEGVSGTSISKRKDFLEMMEDAKAGKIDLILTKSISRFGRNVVDVLTSLRELNNLSPPVTVSFETEGITSAGSNNLLLAVLASVAQMESEQRSLAVKAGIRYRMQEGLYKFTVKNTIGYYRDYAGMLKIEPAEAQIVEYIYDSYLEGASFTAIADSLTQQGIRSPKGMPCWKPGTIRGILTNEKYCGNVLYQKSVCTDCLSHKSVKNKDILPQYYWENTHPAIIPPVKWAKVQEIMASGQNGKRGKPLNAMKKRFAVARVKSGPLRGFILIDLNWTKEERETIIKIIENVQLEQNQAERNENHGY